MLNFLDILGFPFTINKNFLKTLSPSIQTIAETAETKFFFVVTSCRLFDYQKITPKVKSYKN